MVSFSTIERNEISAKSDCNLELRAYLPSYYDNCCLLNWTVKPAATTYDKQRISTHRSWKLSRKRLWILNKNSATLRIH